MRWTRDSLLRWLAVLLLAFPTTVVTAACEAEVGTGGGEENEGGEGEGGEENEGGEGEGGDTELEGEVDTD